jgi:glycosyltransferase involved in cell wall biosynthesis
MRILQVIHQFPPYSSQGSEVHCQQLCRFLSSKGDAVGVFHVSNIWPRRPKRLLRSTADGIKMFHCVDGAEYSRQADWPNSFLQRCFTEALTAFGPDVVHFHHYLSLGDPLVGLAKAKASVVIYTLHDYGLLCPNELLLRDGQKLCEKNSPDFFEGCCPTRIRSGHGRTPRLASQLPSLARWRQFAANQPRPLRRVLLQSAVRLAEQILGSPETTAVAEKKQFFFDATRQIFANADLFLAPSEFLLERYVSCGIPRQKIIHLPYGMHHFPRLQVPRGKEAHLQFGYIGAFHAHKGVDLLIEAFRGLGDRATLHLHGSSFDSPISEAHFKRATAQPIEGVVLHGRYNNSEIASILAGLDAIIVPSRWYENSPLTIQEAQIAGVPVVTADVGGMAELVRDGVNGRHFRCNDSMDLRRVLLSLIEAPDQLNVLRANAPKVPTIETQASQVRATYQRLAGTKRSC